MISQNFANTGTPTSDYNTWSQTTDQLSFAVILHLSKLINEDLKVTSLIFYSFECNHAKHYLLCSLHFELLKLTLHSSVLELRGVFLNELISSVFVKFFHTYFQSVVRRSYLHGYRTCLQCKFKVESDKNNSWTDRNSKQKSV